MVIGLGIRLGIALDIVIGFGSGIEIDMGIGIGMWSPHSNPKPHLNHIVDWYYTETDIGVMVGVENQIGVKH